MADEDREERKKKVKGVKCFVMSFFPQETSKIENRMWDGERVKKHLR